MRGLFALSLAVFILGVPAGLVVWLDESSTSNDHDTASRTQYVKMISNENSPLDPPAQEPRNNIDSSDAYAVPERTESEAKSEIFGRF
jgi:hypothetical protein